MRFFYKLLFSLGFILFFWSSINLEVCADWYKYTNNPTLSPTNDTWDSDGIRHPSVLIDNNVFKIWYEGYHNNYWQIGYATSTDGISWTKNNQPVVRPTSPEYAIIEPVVIKNDKYRMWYKIEPGATIGYAESTDGINWTRSTTPVLIGEKPWELGGVANPFVIYDETIPFYKYKLWYNGIGPGFPYQIGYAESADGINWIKKENNPLLLTMNGHAGAPSVLFSNNQYEIYYHTGGAAIYRAYSSDGVTNWVCPNNNCVVLQTQGNGFDSSNLIGPSVVHYNNNNYLFYSGLSSMWQIGLATEQPILEKRPIIIIPGLFSSWNKNALFYNQTVDQSDWQLNPIVHEYDGITKTLENLGYEKDKNYFLFNYDWRNSLESLSDDLNSFVVSNNLQNQNFEIVGHSLGGLVGRIYLQKYLPANLNKLITIGSPHQGTAQTYKLVEAGEIDRYDKFMWLAQRLILQLNRTGLQTDRQVINDKFPVARDLFPVYDFLTNTEGEVVPANDLHISNITLSNYNSSVYSVIPTLGYIAGQKGDTIKGFHVGPRSIVDQLFDNYPDGKPEFKTFAPGDYVITTDSAIIGFNGQILNVNHSELIYDQTGIKTILDELNIPYQNNQITVGVETQMFPALLFLVLSPVKLEVTINNQIFEETDGVLLIENAATGSYNLKALGQNTGRYTIIIGQISDKNDQWNKIEGEITAINPQQIDQYRFDFDSVTADEMPVNQNNPQALLDEIIIYLKDINRTLNRNEIKHAVSNLKKSKLYLTKNQNGKLKSTLLLVSQQLLNARKKVETSNKVKILYAIEKLEIAYGRCLINYTFGVFPARLAKDLYSLKTTVINNQQYLLRLKNQGKNVTYNALTLNEIENRINKADSYLREGQFNFAEINIISAIELLKDNRIILR